MSNPPLDTGECSREVEALFELGRSSYAPTEAERARVRSALARKLAEASLTGTPPGGLADGASGLTVSYVVAVGVGVACLMVGTLALKRAVDARQPSAVPAIAAQTRTAGEPPIATPVERVATRAAVLKPAPLDAQPARAARVQGMAPAPGTARASRARSAAQKASPPAAALSATRSAALAPPAPAASAAVATRDDVTAPPMAARPNASIPAMAPNPQASAAEAAATESSPPAGQDPGDARAELGLIARMHTALQQAKPKSVLALCVEHERRWPHGTFAQERQGLRAVAACRVGAVGAGALARAFLVSYPRGPLAARVRDACGAAP